MNQKQNKEELVKIPRKTLLVLLASDIKGKNLFAKQVSKAKEILSHAKLIK